MSKRINHNADVEIIGEENQAPVGGTYFDGRPLLKCCTHLRCKSLYYSGIERPGLLHESNVMTYWCNLTQEAIGCDDGDTTPSACQPNRECCEM